MKRLIALAILLLSTAAASAQEPARHQGGEFDYYVLSLSWSPSWCAQEGAEDGAGQCDPGRRLGFVVHGLWPQYERGWPSDCRTDARDPSRRDTRQMADLMGSGGLAWYQWKKHGRCSGLSAADYFAVTREAAKSVHLPEVLQKLSRDVSLPAKVVEEAFLEANPGMTRDGITVTCRARALQEVRICLTRELSPRACAPDNRADCRGSFSMPAPR